MQSSSPSIHTSQDFKRPQKFLCTHPSKLFDSFSFQDKITRRKIMLSKLKTRYKQNFPTQQSIHINFESTVHDEAHSLGQQLKIFTQTHFFKKEALKQQLYKKKHLQNCPQICQQQKEQNQQKVSKRKMAKTLTNKIYQINKQQLRRVIRQNCKVDSSVMNLSKAKFYKINPLKLDKIKLLTDKIQSQSYVVAESKKSNNFTKANDIKFQCEQIFKDKMMNHMKNVTQNNFEYMIEKPINRKVPQRYLLKKLLIEQKQNQIEKTIQPSQLGLKEFKLKPLQLPVAMTQIKNAVLLCQQSKSRKKSPREHLLFSLIKNGRMFDLNCQLLENSQLYIYVDKEGNNVLHYAIKAKRIQIFQFLLKFQGSATLLNQANNMKRTPIQLAKNLGMYQFLKLVQQALQNQK